MRFWDWVNVLTIVLSLVSMGISYSTYSTVKEARTEVEKTVDAIKKAREARKQLLGK